MGIPYGGSPMGNPHGGSPMGIPHGVSPVGNPHGDGEGGESPHRLTAHCGDTVMARLTMKAAACQIRPPKSFPKSEAKLLLNIEKLWNTWYPQPTTGSSLFLLA